MITANDFHTYYQPHECRRRVWLDANHPELRAELAEFEQALLEKGKDHEQEHLGTLGEYASPEYPPGDLTAGTVATLNLISAEVPVIYQGVLISGDGNLTGKPDFLIREGDAYVVRDTKLALSLDRHPEITAQIGFYVELAHAVGVAVVRGEVVLGDGTMQAVAPFNPSELVVQIAAMKVPGAEPDEAVGWSKCNTCGFFGHCWEQAVDAHDLAVVPDINQSMRNVLRQKGVERYDDLPSIPVAQLAEVMMPWGNGERRIGERTAEKVSRQTKVLMSGQLEVLATPETLPPGPVVYFDIESNPWDEGMSTRVYLWGLMLDRGGDVPPQYWGYIAPAGPEGEVAAWHAFLTKSADLIEEFGLLPFVHYSHYEKTWVQQYVTRWGDRDGIAARIQSLLWDMEKKAIRGCLCLPIHSYGLKQVEICSDFKRSQADFGSLWSVGRYNAYMNASNDDQQAIKDELLTYNYEDCLAMRHVLQWASSMG